MKFWLVLLMAGPASAGVVETPVRAAPAALAGAAALGAASVSFDGAGPLRPWLEVPGTPFVRLGSSLIDTRALGATEALKSVTYPDRPVVGIFEPDSRSVLNSFSMGSFGVRGHSDALPPGRDRSELGGYTVFLRPDGKAVFMGSGSVPAAVTPAVQRAVLRHLGVSPAEETALARLRRLWLRALDWASVFWR